MYLLAPDERGAISHLKSKLMSVTFVRSGRLDPARPNSALVADAYERRSRAFFNAAKRERYATQG
jgi:hypothetical protein